MHHLTHVSALFLARGSISCTCVAQEGQDPEEGMLSQCKAMLPAHESLAAADGGESLQKNQALPSLQLQGVHLWPPLLGALVFPGVSA